MINDLWAVNQISVAADSVTCEHKSSQYKSIDYGPRGQGTWYTRDDDEGDERWRSLLCCRDNWPSDGKSFAKVGNKAATVTAVGGWVAAETRRWSEPDKKGNAELLVVSCEESGLGWARTRGSKKQLLHVSSPLSLSLSLSLSSFTILSNISKRRDTKTKTKTKSIKGTSDKSRAYTHSALNTSYSFVRSRLVTIASA